MRFVYFGEHRLGVIAGHPPGGPGEQESGAARIVDVTDLVGEPALSPQDRLETLIARWDELAPALHQAAASRDRVALASVRLRAPVPRPGQLVCMAGNYREPQRPDPAFNAFLKATSAIVGHGDTVELPDAEATVFHFEPELALVMRQPASHISPDEAMDCVFGYTQFLDVSARGLPGGFFLGKSWHTFAPLGPALVTADEVPEPNNLRVRLSVNGRLRQEYTTADMGRPIPQMLADITKVMALELGDVVATGTHHVQLSPIQDGDRVHVSIDGLGPALEVVVHDASQRSWSVPGQDA